MVKPPQVMQQNYLYHNYKITVNLNGVSHVCVHVKSLQLCLTLCNPMNYIACPTPLSMEFSRQEYLSGLPCPPPGYLPDPGIRTASPETLELLADSLPLSHQEDYVSHTPKYKIWKASMYMCINKQKEKINENDHITNPGYSPSLTLQKYLTTKE